MEEILIKLASKILNLNYSEDEFLEVLQDLNKLFSSDNYSSIVRIGTIRHLIGPNWYNEKLEDFNPYLEDQKEAKKYYDWVKSIVTTMEPFDLVVDTISELFKLDVEQLEKISEIFKDKEGLSEKIAKFIKDVYKNKKKGD